MKLSTFAYYRTSPHAAHYRRRPSNAIYKCPQCWRWLPECAQLRPLVAGASPSEPLCECPAERAVASGQEEE